MRRAAWIAVLVVGLAGNAGAQPRRGGPGSAGSVDRRGDPPLGTRERREQIKKKIRAMRAYTLTEELALDEATAGRLFPVLSRYDDEIDKLLEKRVDVQRRLKRADSLRDTRAIDRLIDEAVANQRGFWELTDRRIVDLRKILTPVQSAKLLVVLPAIERKIENQLRKAIEQRRPGGRVDDADDDQEPDELTPVTPPRRRREAPLAPRGDRSNAPGNIPPCDPSTGPCR